MIKDKTTSSQKVTIVDEDRVIHHVDDEQSQSPDGSSPEVTVVDEPIGTQFWAKWATFGRAPLIFTAAIALSLGVGYFLGSLSDSTKANQVTKNETGNEALEIGSAQPPKQELTAEYYAHLSNDELREKGLNLEAQLRRFLLQWGVKERQMAMSLMVEMDAATSQKQKQEVWKQNSEAAEATLEARSLKYEQLFKTKAILLRNELVSRLPDLERNNRVEQFYEKADNPVDLRAVLDDITFLTESLLAQ